MTENNGGNAPLPLADVRVLECCQTIMGPSAGLAVVVGGPMPLNAGLQKARTAAAAQGICSGRHPAITELMAAFSAVTVVFRGGYTARTSCAEISPYRQHGIDGGPGRGHDGQPAGLSLSIVMFD